MRFELVHVWEQLELLHTLDSHLVTGLAAGLQPFSVVSAAVDLPVLEEIYQIDQQLSAGNALETLRVPTAAVTRPTGEHSDVSTTDLSATLEKHIWLGEGTGQDVK